MTIYDRSAEATLEVRVMLIRDEWNIGYEKHSGLSIEAILTKGKSAARKGGTIRAQTLWEDITFPLFDWRRKSRFPQDGDPLRRPPAGALAAG